MRFDNLSDWLDWQSELHPRSIDLGLERSAEVARRLGLDTLGIPTMTVGGTNGKGSCVSYAETMLRCTGHRVGTYMSPHLLRYNERIRINGVDIEDADLLAAFAEIDEARAEISLTFFEFGTLAAIQVFARHNLDYLLLEVGLGGRLDVVNVFEPDVSVLTSIDIDHVDWLGNDREQIGAEKAGIMRSGKPCVVGDANPPQSVLARARELGVELLVRGKDFHATVRPGGRWDWRCGEHELSALEPPALPGEHQIHNAATAIAAIYRLAGPLHEDVVRRGLAEVYLPGRFQTVSEHPEIMVDVGHNCEAARVLSAYLQKHPRAGKTLLLLGMYADKDLEGVARALLPVVDQWLTISLDGARGLDGRAVKRRLLNVHPQADVSVFDSAATAMGEARQRLGPSDRLVAFGSFQTIAEMLQLER